MAKSRSIVLPDWVAIAVVDPGGVTGCARALIPVGSLDSISEAVVQADQLESWEEEGSIADQAQSVVDIMNDWFIEVNMFGNIPVPHMFLVVESFVLRQRHADLSPLKLIERIETLWSSVSADPVGSWPVIEYQTPSDAKSYVTNKRLREWGGWVVGSEHRRDAMRHLLLKASRILQNGVSL